MIRVRITSARERDRVAEVLGRSYDPGELVDVTARQADELQRNGDAVLVPIETSRDGHAER